MKKKIEGYVDSLFTSIVQLFEKVSNGAAMFAHKLVLAQQEIAELRAANQAATRRKSHKRKRIQKKGTLLVDGGQLLIALKDFGVRSDGKKAKKRVRTEVGESFQRRCGRCGEAGHNARMCKHKAERSLNDVTGYPALCSAKVCCCKP